MPLMIDYDYCAQREARYDDARRARCAAHAAYAARMPLVVEVLTPPRLRASRPLLCALRFMLFARLRTGDAVIAVDMRESEQQRGSRRSSSAKRKIVRRRAQRRHAATFCLPFSVRYDAGARGDAI